MYWWIRAKVRGCTSDVAPFGDDSGSSSAQRLYSLDLTTGGTTLLFENTGASGPLAGQQVNGVSFLDASTLLLVTTGTGGVGTGGIYRYDPTSGVATVLATQSLLTGDGLFTVLSPTQVIVRNGRIYVGSTGANGGTTLVWRLVEIDPSNGDQRQIAGGNGQLGDLDASLDAATIYLSARSNISLAPGDLFRVNAATGVGWTTPVAGIDLGIVGGQKGIVGVFVPGTSVRGNVRS